MPDGATSIPARILVVRLGALGDVVNALAFVGAVRRARPDVTIGWAVHDLSAPLVTGHPWIEHVHLWRRADGIVGGFRAAREAREVGYDLVVDLQRIFKSAVFSRLVRAPRTLGYDRARAKEQSWLLYPERVAPGPPRAKMPLQALEFAAHLGCEVGEPERELPRDEESEAWAEETVAGLGGEPVAINLGASKPEKRWAPGRFAELARRLAAEVDAPLVLTGGPADRALFEETVAAADGRRIVDLVGRTSIPQAVALYRRIVGYVGCDTGLAHVASALGKPCVTLFGPSDDERVGPYGDQHRVLRAEASPQDLSQLGVEPVLAAALEMLG